MNIKEKIQLVIKIHTRVVTGIFLFICLYLFWLPGDTTLRITDVLGVQLIGLISGFAYLPLTTEKELSKSKMIFFNILYFLIINISVFVTGYFMNWFSFKIKATVVAIELMIIIIFALTMLIGYKIDNNEASKLNKKLQERNTKTEE